MKPKFEAITYYTQNVFELYYIFYGIITKVLQYRSERGDFIRPIEYLFVSCCYSMNKHDVFAVSFLKFFF